MPEPKQEMEGKKMGMGRGRPLGWRKNVDSNKLGSTGFAQEVDNAKVMTSSMPTIQAIYDGSSIKAEIRNLKSRLDDIELFRNSESIENRIRSLSEEFDNLVSTVNGIKQDILNNVKKYSEEEIKVKISDEVKKLMEKMIK